MPEKDTNTVLDALDEMAELEGLAPGSDPFDHRVRQLKVLKCREFRGLFTCSECVAFDECSLIKQVMRDHRGI